MEQLVKEYLHFLCAEKREPSLDYLHELINSHQLRVRWENITKILDTEKGIAGVGESYLPPINRYISRMTKQGMGGTCWTLAIGFKWLLDRLGFDVEYMYMDSGHLCLQVNLEQSYYVDVGYCAPLFKAYPLNKSFEVLDVRETFQFTVEEQSITIIREPGPTKTLNPKPVQLSGMYPLIARSNNWETSAALQNLSVFGYIDEIPTSLTNRILKQYFKDEKVEKELDEEELMLWIVHKFKMDPDLYMRAKKIYDVRHGCK